MKWHMWSVCLFMFSFPQFWKWVKILLAYCWKWYGCRHKEEEDRGCWRYNCSSGDAWDSFWWWHSTWSCKSPCIPLTLWYVTLSNHANCGLRFHFQLKQWCVPTSKAATVTGKGWQWPAYTIWSKIFGTNCNKKHILEIRLFFSGFALLVILIFSICGFPFCVKIAHRALLLM